MSKTNNYFILNYKDETTSKQRAHVIRFSKNNNLLSLYNDFKTITNLSGEIATLNIIHYCDTEKAAYELCECWNNTYKKQGSHFDF